MAAPIPFGNQQTTALATGYDVLPLEAPVIRASFPSNGLGAEVESTAWVRTLSLRGSTDQTTYKVFKQYERENISLFAPPHF